MKLGGQAVTVLRGELVGKPTVAHDSRSVPIRPSEPACYTPMDGDSDARRAG